MDFPISKRPRLSVSRNITENITVNTKVLKIIREITYTRNRRSSNIRFTLFPCTLYRVSGKMTYPTPHYDSHSRRSKSQGVTLEQHYYTRQKIQDEFRVVRGTMPRTSRDDSKGPKPTQTFVPSSSISTPTNHVLMSYDSF